MTLNCAASEDAWAPVHDFPVLHGDEVHVWLIMSGGHEFPDVDIEILNENERERLRSMKSAAAKQEFAVSRFALRRMLGHYLDLAPASVPLVYGERGKPELELASNLHFNLSHNRGGTLIALGRAGALGVDIEGLDREVDWKAIARRYFSAAEVQRLEQSGWNRRRFFETWTCKEACLKAAGHGISIELSGIDTGTVTAATPASVRVVFEAGIQDWFVQLLPEIEGYTAALATADSGLRVKTWRWALSD